MLTALEMKADAKELEPNIERYLGTHYRFGDVNAQLPCASRMLLTDGCIRSQRHRQVPETLWENSCILIPFNGRSLDGGHAWRVFFQNRVLRMWPRSLRQVSALQYKCSVMLTDDAMLVRLCNSFHCTRQISLGSRAHATVLAVGRRPLQ